jgi:mannose-6-phosphate isomerase-like protein (cupin superfamily)
MGHKQSLSFSVRKGVLKYHVTHGEAWISVNNKGQVVKAGDDIIVEEGEMHKFFNNSKTVEWKFVCEYAGPLDMRKFLDIENAVIEG